MSPTEDRSPEDSQPGPAGAVERPERQPLTAGLPLAEIVEVLAQAVVATDEQSGNAYLNHAAASLLGVSEGSVTMAVAMSALVTLRQRVVNADEVRRVVEALAQDPTTVVRDSVWELQGRPSHLAVSSFPIHSEAGLGRVWVFDDVTAHFDLVRQAEDARREQAAADERFRLAMRQAGVGMSLVSPDGTYLAVNDAMCELLGRTAVELVGHTWQEFTHPDDAPIGVELAAEVLADQREAFHHRKRYLRPSGEVVWADLSAAVVRNADRSVAFFVNNARDVSEQVAVELAAERERALLRSVSDGVLEPLVLLEAVRDAGGTIADLVYVEANRAAIDYLGLARDELIGHSIAESLPNITTSGLFGKYAEAVDSSSRLQLTDFAFDNDLLDQTRRYDISAVGIDGMLSLTWRDVTERFEASARIAASEARFRAAMVSAPTGVAIVGPDNTFLQVNPSLCRLLGRSQDWLLRHSLSDVIHPQDLAADVAMRDRLLTHDLPAASQQIRLLTPDGVVWVDHAIGLIRDEAGTPVSSVSQFMDVTAAREARQFLQFLADHDPLTDLKNRRGIVSTIAAVLSHPPRTGTRLGVLFCDVDGLKPVNDLLGHATGDAVIVEVARRLRRNIRSGDSVGRLGGDEFVVVLTSLGTVDDAHRLAEKLRADVARPIDVDGTMVNVTMSVGIRVADPGEDPEQILRQADIALYQAKATGRNRVVVYDPSAEQ